MRRVGLRALMALVGLSLFVAYASAAYLSVRLLAAAWSARLDLLAVAAWTTAVAVALGYLSYRFGTARLLSRLDAGDLPRHRAPRAHARLDRVAERMDAGRPRLLAARMAMPNALALDAPGGGAVVVDRRLFGVLSGAEFEALVAHELAHLETRDALVQTLAYSAGQTLVWAVVLALLPLVLVATGVRRALDWFRGRPPARSGAAGSGLRAQVGRVVMVAFVALTLVVLAYSRRREFAADDRAAEVTGDPLALARALRKIERASTPPWGLLSPLYVRGDDEGPITRLLSTHPSMDERVERLAERAERETGRPGPIR